VKLAVILSYLRLHVSHVESPELLFTVVPFTCCVNVNTTDATTGVVYTVFIYDSPVLLSRWYRFVCVIRVPVCALLSRVCPVCVPAHPGVFEPFTCCERVS
jgi:hypothetical protein